ncbi:MAG: glycosyltransferase [Kiritimatiellae bacterium]|nr:glycosyltransferase [Kiritimatiellia bacterium]
MKILHAITSLRKSAGTTTFVKGVANTLAESGHDMTIAILKIDDHFLGERPSGKVKVVTFDDILSGSESFDVVHLHGLWEMPVIKIARWAAKRRIRIVWSPHGAMSPWAMRHKWWKKRIFWHLFQKRALRLADLFHVTSAKESDWIRALGFAQPVVDAPLGTTIPPPRDSNQAVLDHKPSVLFVGRIYVVKGLANLLRAWALLPEALRARWRLRIVGPDQAGYRKELERLAAALKVDDNVEFPGEKFGTELECEYDDAGFLVLPSFTENFGAVVVDALAHSKPCIASIYTPWQRLQTEGCGWWVDNTPRALAEALQAMMEMTPEEREKMGENGRRFAARVYAWDAIAAALISAYAKIACNSREIIV